MIYLLVSDRASFIDGDPFAFPGISFQFVGQYPLSPFQVFLQDTMVDFGRSGKVKLEGIPFTGRLLYGMAEPVFDLPAESLIDGGM